MKKGKTYPVLLIILYWVAGINFLTVFSIYPIRGYLFYAGIDPAEGKGQMATYWLSPTQFVGL